MYSKIYSSLYTVPSAVLRPTSLPCSYRKMSSLIIEIRSGQYVYAKSVFNFSRADDHETVTPVQTVFSNPGIRPAKIDHFAIHSFEVDVNTINRLCSGQCLIILNVVLASHLKYGLEYSTVKLWIIPLRTFLQLF